LTAVTTTTTTTTKTDISECKLNTLVHLNAYAFDVMVDSSKTAITEQFRVTEHPGD